MLEGAFRGSAAVAAGRISRAVLEGPRYQRVFPDIYLPADAPLDLATRSRAAYLWASGRGVLGGYSATEIYAAWCAPTDAPVEIVLPGRHKHPPLGVVTLQHRLATTDRRTYRGLTVTTPARTAYDLARRLDLVEGVVAVDALVGRFGFPATALLELAAREPRARGRRRVAEVVAHVEPLAESPMESRLRMALVLAGLPRPAAQHGVPDRRARIVAVVDLAYPTHRIAIEYEGEDHFNRERSMRDVHRYTRLVDLGWRVYRYRARDLFQEPHRIASEIRRALAVRSAG